jgi:hypothetical protein
MKRVKGQRFQGDELFPPYIRVEATNQPWPERNKITRALDELSHSLHGVLNGSRLIDAMQKEKIDRIYSQLLGRVFKRLTNVFWFSGNRKVVRRREYKSEFRSEKYFGASGRIVGEISANESFRVGLMRFYKTL